MERRVRKEVSAALPSGGACKSGAVVMFNVRNNFLNPLSHPYVEGTRRGFYPSR